MDEYGIPGLGTYAAPGWDGSSTTKPMPVLLGDLLLFFCLAATVTGMVIAITSLLS
jgi:hypothetical protein